MKVRKRPVEVSAWEITPELEMLVKDKIMHLRGMNPEVRVKTPEGTMIGKFGDYLIRGVEGEYYICKREIFWKTYERIEDVR